jgi:hypothetical protein
MSTAFSSGRTVVGVLVWLLSAGAALAQSGEPRGPADIIKGATQARDRRQLKQAGERAAEAVQAAGERPDGGVAVEGDVDPGAGAAPSARDPHAGMGGMPEARPIATERPNPSLATGTIRVRVVDPEGRPAPFAEIELATMKADSTRSASAAKAGADGIALFTGLASGDRQAYRVNVPFKGAKYSSSPFRMPFSGGYDVEVRRLPVTHDARMLVTYVGATSVELKDDRLKVVQQTRLMNVGRETYVFPEAGTLVPFPKGYLAFQTQDAMTDQRVVEAPGEGARVHGSLPPGEATLLWAFDMPLSGTEARFSIDLPWLVFAYRVISDAPDGMSLRVADMPEPWMHRDQGRRFWVTETQRHAGDAAFRRVELTITGIPGPGPGRFIATLLALGVIGVGVVISVQKRGGNAQQRIRTDFDERKRELLVRARMLQAQQQAGEIGAEYHREQMAELTDELAALLFEQAQYDKHAPSSARS